MKEITYTIGLLPILVVLAVATSCRQNDMIPALHHHTLIESHYVHDYPTGTVLSVKSGEPLLTLVRIRVLEDFEGNHVIVIGEPSLEDTRVFYLGTEGGFLRFRLVPGGGSLSDAPSADQLVRFPEGSLRIELWGTPLELISITNGRLKCRVAGPSLTI